MIYPYDNATRTRWGRGELRVQLEQPDKSCPIGYCDGSAEDLAALLSMAEAEGAGEVPIHKKVLKSGREIWTLGEATAVARTAERSADRSAEGADGGFDGGSEEL